MKLPKRKIIFDAVLIGGLVLTAAIPPLVLLTRKTGDGDLYASISVKGEEKENINLSKENEERYFIVEGIGGNLTVGVKKDGVCVKESDCHNHICVHQGWVSKANRIIVCAPLEVTIRLYNQNISDVEVGA